MHRHRFRIGVRSAVLLLVAACLAGHEASAQVDSKDYSTAAQREHLLSVQQSLCAVGLSTSQPLSAEASAHIDALSAMSDPVAVLAESGAALQLAENRIGEGRGRESHVLLCSVVEARARAIGIAAPRTILVFNAFAVLLRKLGRAGEARRLLQALEPITEQYPSEGASMKRMVLNNLGVTLLVQGYHEQAEATLRRALDFATARADVTSTLTNIAKALEARRRWREAETLYREVLKLRKAGPEVRWPEVAAALNNLGENLSAQGRLPQGEALIREALRIRVREMGPTHLNVANSLASLAGNLSLQGRAAHAVPLASRLVELRRAGLGETHSETSAGYRLLALAELSAGSTDRAMIAARKALDSAAALADREADGVDDSSRETLRHAPALAASTVAAVAWRITGGPVRMPVRSVGPAAREAFVATQRMAISSTFESLLSAGARQAGAADGKEALIAAFEATLASSAQLDADLARAAASGQPLNALQEELQGVEARRGAAAAALRASYPAYFGLVRPQPLQLEEVAALLMEDEALVLVAPGIGSHKGYVWVVTRNEFAWRQLAWTADALATSVQNFRQTLDPGNAAMPQSSVRPAAPNWKAGNAVYTAIFGAPKVSGVLASKARWILAPQGALVALPFNALPMSLPSTGLPSRPSAARLRSMRWLGLERALPLVPSVAAVKTLRSRSAERRTDMRPFFGLGDPHFPDSKVGRLFQARTRTATASDLATLRQLDPLPGSRQEIERLATTLNAPKESYLLGAHANERELWARNHTGELQRARVVAFATHGLMGGELSESTPEPALVLTPPATATQEDDGLLTASEVRRMKLDAEWVLLSACNTGAGRTQQAEGLTGLGSAFLFAGARSLLVSHWRVADTVSARLSARVIELSSGTGRRVPKTTALRQAMREIMADDVNDHDPVTTLAHPAAWAPFVFVGLD